LKLGTDVHSTDWGIDEETAFSRHISKINDMIKQFEQNVEIIWRIMKVFAMPSNPVHQIQFLLAKQRQSWICWNSRRK